NTNTSHSSLRKDAKNLCILKIPFCFPTLRTGEPYISAAFFSSIHVNSVVEMATICIKIQRRALKDNKAIATQSHRSASFSASRMGATAHHLSRLPAAKGGGQPRNRTRFTCVYSADQNPTCAAARLKWCRLYDSNARPAVYKTAALPLS